MKLEDLIQNGFNIAQAAIDQGFAIDNDSAGRCYVRLFKGRGPGRLMILVGKTKVYFVVQTGDYAFQTKEAGTYWITGQQTEALAFLRTEFLLFTQYSFTDARQ